jgi:hypothetical protein
MKEDLKMLILKLHTDVISYMKGLSENPEALATSKTDIDNTLHNIFYLLKVIRAKYDVKLKLEIFF